MVFRVADPAMLKQMKLGDKVQFEAERHTVGNGRGGGIAWEGLDIELQA